MIIKRIPSDYIDTDTSFPDVLNAFDDSLRTALFTVWWTEIPEGSDTEYAILMDYDGFIKFYNENRDRFNNDSSSVSAEDYLVSHIFRTVDPIKFVDKDYIP